MGFGALRVLNDDVIAPLGKFAMHGHQNFEIITIPLRGAVTHEDSLGSRGVVGAGEVQVMSAGTGIVHSEYNASATEPLELFQIWIEPSERGVAPRYAQQAFGPSASGAWQVLVSDGSVPGSLMIHQRARIARATIAAGKSLEYTLASEGNGVYLLVVSGRVRAAGATLDARDALGVSEVLSLELEAVDDAEVLAVEIPFSAR